MNRTFFQHSSIPEYIARGTSGKERGGELPGARAGPENGDGRRACDRKIFEDQHR